MRARFVNEEIGKPVVYNKIYDRNPDHDVDESVNERFEHPEEDSLEDYSEAFYKMDKFMPNEEGLQNEFYDIIENSAPEEVIDELVMFLQEYADIETMEQYFPEGGTIEEFADYINQNYNQLYPRKAYKRT